MTTKLRHRYFPLFRERWHSCCAPSYTKVVKSTRHKFSDDFSKKQFWEKKYRNVSKNENGFDWFFKSELIMDNIKQTVSEIAQVRQSALQILDLGCGTSDLPATIFTELKDTPLILHCLDFVRTAVEYQREKLDTIELHVADKNLKAFNNSVKFVVADAKELPYPQSFFDIIIDKGTADSILRSPTTDRITNCHKVIGQSVNCLRSGGVLIQVTDEDPDCRLSLIEDSVAELQILPQDISITHTELNTDESFHYFMYFIKKLIPNSQSS